MASCEVTINPDTTPAFMLNSPALTIKINDTYQFIISGNASSIMWNSSNPEVAEIDSKGLLKAKAPGTTTIIAANNYGYVAACIVTVTTSDAGVGIVEDSTFAVHSVGLEIVVDGIDQDELLYVYDLKGSLIYSGYERRVAMQSPGIYIVACSRGVKKMALRQ